MELKLSENIRLKRRERGISQEQLAEMLGVAPQTVSHWECGDTYPDMTLLPILAGFFGTTTDELLGVSGVLANERKRRYSREAEDITDNEKRIAHYRRAWRVRPRRVGVRVSQKADLASAFSGRTARREYHRQNRSVHII